MAKRVEERATMAKKSRGNALKIDQGRYGNPIDLTRQVE